MYTVNSLLSNKVLVIKAVVLYLEELKSCFKANNQLQNNYYNFLTLCDNVYCVSMFFLCHLISPHE